MAADPELAELRELVKKLEIRIANLEKVVKLEGHRKILDFGTSRIVADPTSFTIQRATNLSFTTGLNTSTVAGTASTLTQTVNDNTTYYYRIRANTAVGSSAWTNALPFPIRTGN